jgi:hypothetical protein
MYDEGESRMSGCAAESESQSGDVNLTDFDLVGWPI